MIKTKSLLITIMLSVILTGCASAFQASSEKNQQNQTTENMTLHPGTADNTDKNTPASLSDEDFIVKNENTFIELNGNYENLITNEEIVNVRYLDEKRAYDTYVYENFIVSVSPTPYNTVFFINLVTSELETSRGIRVGDFISDVFEKYGLVDGNSYMYHYDDKILTFYIDKDGKVTNIKFEMI
ncbi:MAG: hypothetical protein ACK5H4_11190 [Lacrimispora sphenoides]